jgi:hypothetical protein
MIVPSVPEVSMVPKVLEEELSWRKTIGTFGTAETIETNELKEF